MGLEDQAAVKRIADEHGNGVVVLLGTPDAESTQTLAQTVATPLEESINGVVHSIGGSLSSLRPVVVEINNGVAAINGRADRAIPIVRGIRVDLNNVLVEVGPGHGRSTGGSSIAGHANSIDCSTAVRGAACGQ